METLLIRPSEITEFTPLGGNVDTDKYLFVVFDVQVTVIQSLLGDDLYNKIIEDFTNESLTGEYETLYTDYIKPILRHQVFAEYVEIGSYMVTNAGIFKHAPENSEVVSKSEVQYLAQTERSKSQLMIDRAERWLRKSSIEEYKDRGCDGRNNIQTSSGWHL
jgi:hypothetical protein